MAKEPKYEKGKRISGKKANADKYIPLFEFLMFDPLYREMPDKAKVLYSYLRNKVPYFEMQTELNQQGVEETKSYLDENGDIYILADNTELMYILNCSEPTLIKMKDVLFDYGLLDEEQKKQTANRIYVLEPSKLSDTWTHINEINKLRSKREEERKIKKEKLKTKKLANNNGLKRKKKKDNKDLKNLSPKDLKNLSPKDLKNLSPKDLKNLSEIEPNSFKSNLSILNRPKDQDLNVEDNPNLNKKGQGQKVNSDIDLERKFFQIDSEVAFKVYKDLSMGIYNLPSILINKLKEEIKRDNTFRDDFDLREVENLYQKFKSLIDNDFEPGWGLREWDVLTESEFTSTIMALYKNGDPVRFSFKKQLENWFNNKFDFKKIDEMRKIIERNEIEDLPY